VGFTQAAVGLLPDRAAQRIMMTAGVDKLAALQLAIECVSRGGTVSLSGVYGGNADPLPLMTMFDRQLTVRMGQCNVQSWRDTLLPLVEDPDDPLGVDDLVTHRASLENAPQMYEMFKKKADGCIKVVLTP
jgi:threonine dehydrogenase-like Zn-dependent dehydrogenase